MEDKIYKEYCAILAEELQPAMGCTEPIAVAYCAALARKTLGCLPEDVQVYASANIIKNVKSVVVPHTGGLRGIPAAAAAGMAAGAIIGMTVAEKRKAMKTCVGRTMQQMGTAVDGALNDLMHR